MKLRDLSYFVVLSQTLHFGKAAVQSHVSQPTLSVQIKKLEERLGLTLIERDNKNVRLTPEGKIIAEKAQRVLHEIDAIKTYAKAVQDPKAGDLHLGIIPTLGPYLLPQAIPLLHKKLPKLSMWLHEAQTEVLIAQLQTGELDLAILALPIEAENLHTVPLFTESFYFAVHSNHPLAKKKELSPKEIAGEKILLLTDGHCLRDQALEFCQHHHSAPLGDFKATSLETLRQMVAQGLGATLMPALATRDAHANICYIPFKKNPPSRQLGLAFRKTHVRAPLMLEMAQMIQQHFSLHNSCNKGR
ncbi:MAG TPA: LysR substrate-binding domain-containing protein [Gammaproteobacteria bacterium]|nr:LysR substrate-binding domain-containing protein [Gammaproteobacteria bacterium]